VTVCFAVLSDLIIGDSVHLFLIRSVSNNEQLGFQQ